VITIGDLGHGLRIVLGQASGERGSLSF
jgi:hypothetical protein